MELIELELSIKSIGILQKAGVALLDDIIDKMSSDPTAITLALAKIKPDDFVEITEAIKKRTNNVLDN
tara:strand:- start:17 stop:220 length:204 start_codon:yes stop_codon:yes gene_type:complete